MVMTEKGLQKKGKRTAHKTGTLREIGFFALCFFAPVLLMALIWGEMGISYGGVLTPLTYDMEAQYMPFYASLRYILSGENSLLFSWSFFMGSNFLGAYALDLASPLSWLTVFWSLENMPDAIYVLTLLKIGLCGLSFAFFTRFGLSKEPERSCGIANVLFSCCYALMSYTVVYSWCLPWLEEVILLPLILLGIEKLLQGKKGFLYFISIAGVFICNYYISYMVGIFAAVYILCRVLSEITKENQKKMFWALFRFGTNTVLALGISLPLLLPALQNLIGNLEEKDTTPPSGAYAFSFWQLLQKLLPGQYDSLENWGLPSIYCGSIMALLAAAYFFLKKYSLREKLSYALMAAAPFAGFLWKEIDYAWHGFSYPNSAPYRYAFLVSTVILLLAWKTYICLPMADKMTKLIACILGCYLCVELFFNGSAMVNGIHEQNHYVVRSSYDWQMEYALPLTEEVRGEEGFARAEIIEQYGNSDANALYGLRGIRSFHSAGNRRVQNFLFAVGSQFRHGMSPDDGLSPVGDSLLGVKYRITDRGFCDGYEVKSISTGHWGADNPIRLYLQENKNALSLGYPADEAGIRKGCIFGDNVFENQNRILQAMGVEEPEVFKKVSVQSETGESGKTITFTALSQNPVYCYLLADREWAVFDGDLGEWVRAGERMDMHLMGENLRANGQIAHKTSQYLGTFPKGERITLEVEEDNISVNDIYIYELDTEKYEKAMKELKEGEFRIVSLKGGHIRGSVTAREGQMLFLTLPADSGYQVKVDGKDSAYMTVFDTFLGIPLGEGEHWIEITYIPPCLREGITAGLLAFVLAGVYFGKRKLTGCKKAVSFGENH
ncbi:MAG: YfhO family protein [Lachnospira sp.]|nr:YfhO family protein [Lachnospira sp.]